MSKADIKKLIENLFDTSNTSKKYENGCIKLFLQLHREYGVTSDEFIIAKDEIC